MKNSFLKIIVVGLCLYSATAHAVNPKEGVIKLKESLLVIGEPKIEGEAVVFGTKVPALKFGALNITMNYKNVDELKKSLGCTATVFVKNGEEFVRVSTNVLKDDGTRAVSTTLARNKAYETVSKGKLFCDEVDILGHKYDTCYDPIKIADKVVGIYYFGCKK